MLMKLVQHLKVSLGNMLLQHNVSIVLVYVCIIWDVSVLCLVY
jgi:hypothetical protein